DDPQLRPHASVQGQQLRERRRARDPRVLRPQRSRSAAERGARYDVRVDDVLEARGHELVLAFLPSPLPQRRRPPGADPVPHRAIKDVMTDEKSLKFESQIIEARIKGLQK